MERVILKEKVGCGLRSLSMGPAPSCVTDYQESDSVLCPLFSVVCLKVFWMLMVSLACVVDPS